MEGEIEELLADLKSLGGEAKRLEGTDMSAAESGGVGVMSVSITAVRGLNAGDKCNISCAIDDKTFEFEGEADANGTAT